MIESTLGNLIGLRVLIFDTVVSNREREREKENVKNEERSSSLV